MAVLDKVAHMRCHMPPITNGKGLVQNVKNYTGQHQLLLSKKMGDSYGTDVAETKYGNQIAPTPNMFESETYKLKNYICSKIYI
jgi:hypothetical protein